MKRLIEAMSLAALLAAPVAGIAAVPQTLSFAARVADAGTPVTGSHDLAFAFWDCDGADTVTCTAPGHVLWEETQTRAVNEGVVAAVLGSDAGNPLPGAMFDGAPLWLAVSMDGAAFGPRMAIHSVPYAIRAGVAEAVQCNGCVQDAAIQGVSASKVTGAVASATSADTATAATTAATATGLSCGATCVQDAEIESVSGSKVSGAVASALVAGSVAWSSITGRPAFTCGTYETTITVNANALNGADIQCPSGTRATGGGYQMDWAGTEWLQMFKSAPYPSGDGWSIYGWNPATSARTFRAYVRCCSF